MPRLTNKQTTLQNFLQAPTLSVIYSEKKRFVILKFLKKLKKSNSNLSCTELILLHIFLKWY